MQEGGGRHVSLSLNSGSYFHSNFWTCFVLTSFKKNKNKSKTSLETFTSFYNAVFWINVILFYAKIFFYLLTKSSYLQSGWFAIIQRIFHWIIN